MTFRFNYEYEIKTVLYPVTDSVPVAKKVDSAIHRIDHYPLYNRILFPYTYPLVSVLSHG